MSVGEGGKGAVAAAGGKVIVGVGKIAARVGGGPRLALRLDSRLVRSGVGVEGRRDRAGW